MMKIAFLGLVFAFCAVLLKNLGWRGASVFSALGIAVILTELRGSFSEIGSFGELWKNLGEGGVAILKIMGLGYLFGISADLCRELGEGGISSALTLVGRFEIIAVALPFIHEIFSLAISLVS
jgi:hypothetical protein